MQEENEYVKLWKRIENMPKELQEIYFTYWDETGRPTHENSGTLTIIAMLKKNANEGYKGFKKDMDIFYENKMSEYELETHYGIFMAGAKYIADKINGKSDTNTPSVIKPK